MINIILLFSESNKSILDHLLGSCNCDRLFETTALELILFEQIKVSLL